MNNDFQTSLTNNTNNFSDKAKTAWATVPLFVRFVIITSCAFYIISWFIPYVDYLVNVPYYSIGSFQIWRLLTSTFINLSIFNLIFAFIFWIPDAIRLENTSGTVRYSLNFLINSCLVNVLFAVVIGILSVIMQSSYLLMFSSFGLWPVIMSEITMLCIANPENTINFLMLPIEIKSKFYPWVLVLFMSLLSFSIRLDLLAGIGYGYLFFFYLRQKVHFDDNVIIQWENNGFVKSISNYTGFIPVQITQGYSGFNNESNTQDHYNASSYNNNLNSNSGNNFKGKGTVVGK